MLGGMWRHVGVGGHVGVRHGRRRHVLLRQGRLRHHVGGLRGRVEGRVGVHVHGLLLSLLLPRRRSRHPLLAAWHLVLAGMARRHPVVVLSHPRHPRLSWTPGDLVLTLVAR